MLPLTAPPPPAQTEQNGESEAGLSASERAYLRRLQAADASIRNHEGLHFRAAGGLGSLPNFQTVTGPDGNQYAIAGSVDVSSTQGADTERAAREAQTLVNAATAPADASAADLNAAKKFGQQNVGSPESEPRQDSSQNEPPTAPGEVVNVVV